MEQNDSYLLASVEDKIKLANKMNKIKNTAFLTVQERKNVEKYLTGLKKKQYCFAGGFTEAERQVLVVYSNQFEPEMVQRNLNNILQAIKIQLPKELRGQYQHGDYLSSLMRIGLERDRFGDIVVFEDEAYIVVLKENASYIVENLKQLTRFQKATISEISISEMKTKEVTFEDLKIVIASNRLDNFVAELAKCSRKQAEEFLLAERVLVNNEIITKQTKQMKESDVITIRGKGKFIVDQYMGMNKKERMIYEIKKYH